MKFRRRSILSMLDEAVRWTGMPARVAAQMSNDPGRKHRPLRWIPIWPIAFSCAPLILSLAWPPAMDRWFLSIMGVFWGCSFSWVPSIHSSGPLGRPSLEDDEREAALRKESFLFCLWLLAVLNCLGQPVLMILSHWQGWKLEQTASVVTSAFMVNATLLGCLPTLYASWKLPQFPKE